MQRRPYSGRDDRICIGWQYEAWHWNSYMLSDRHGTWDSDDLEKNAGSNKINKFYMLLGAL